MPINDAGVYVLPAWHEQADTSSAGQSLAAFTPTEILVGGVGRSALGAGSVHLFADEVSGLVRPVSYSTIYRCNPWLRAVVQLKARSFSRMPPKVFRYDPGSGLELRAKEGRGAQLEARLRKPGRGVAWQARQMATMVDYQVHGNALWVIRSDSQGISGFDQIGWARVTTSTDSTGGVVYEAQPALMSSGVGERETFNQLDVIHFGYCEDPDSPLENPSPIASLSATLALFDAVYQQVLQYFHNGARPSAHFKVDRATSPEVLNALTTAIAASYQGTRNAGKVIVSPGEYTPITTSPDQTKIIELAKQSREEICGVFGVAPPLVGILERAIFSNVKELRNFTMRDTVGPDVEMMAGQITAQVGERRPNYANVRTDFEAAAQLKPDIEAIAESLPNQLRITTPNEMRAKFNMGPLDDPAASMIWDPQRAPEPEPEPSEEDTDE